MNIKKTLSIFSLTCFLLWTVCGYAQTSSDRKSLLVERTGNQKWALLIGVNDYSYVTDLKFCGNDIVALQKQLLAVGFPKDHVTLMHEGAKDRRYQPFKSNIEVELELLLGELDETGTRLKKRGLAEPGDLVIVAFSGHGIHPTGENKSYFCPIDAIVNKSRSMIPLDKIYKLLELSPAGVKLLMVDACRNDPRPGGQKAMKATTETKGFAKTLENPPKGILVLSSCAPGQVSWEDEKIQHGVFMKYVLEGLGGAADQSVGDRNQRVSLLELYRYTSDKTKTYVARTRGQLQTPALKGDITGDFEFGTLAFPKPDLLIAPFTKRVASIKQEEWSKYLKSDVDATNSIGMKLTLVPAGEFMMGSSEEDESLFGASPQHHVRITKPYYLAETEVTQKQWKLLMGTTPWRAYDDSGKALFKEGDRYATTNVSWNDTQLFLKKLSDKEGITYRLPTEAEWEYACRAGTESKYYFGDSLDRSSEYDFFGPLLTTFMGAERLDLIHLVAQKKPNNFGWYDMHGGVGEWCGDWYNSNYYNALDEKTSIDPQGPNSGTKRSNRGGNSFLGADYGTSSGRSMWKPEEGLFFLGFRVVRVIN